VEYVDKNVRLSVLPAFRGVEVILEPLCRQLSLNIWHIISFRNVIRIKRTASAVYWLVLPFRERKNFMRFS